MTNMGCRGENHHRHRAKKAIHRRTRRSERIQNTRIRSDGTQKGRTAIHHRDGHLGWIALVCWVRAAACAAVHFALQDVAWDALGSGLHLWQGCDGGAQAALEGCQSFCVRPDVNMFRCCVHRFTCAPPIVTPASLVVTCIVVLVGFIGLHDDAHVD